MWIRRLFSFDVFIFTLVWLLLISVGRTKLFKDPGTFSHTAIGEHILNARTVIDKDIFSFTFYGQDWVAQQWLGECFMALLHRAGGLDALLVMTVSVIAILYSWLALKICRSGMNLILGTMILLLALAASSHHLHVRPHISSIVFLAVVFSWLCDFESGRANLRSLFWLLPVFALWTNIHGGILGGLITFFVVAVGWTISLLLGFDSPIRNGKDTVILWILLLLSGAMILVTPYGLALPETWLSIIKSPLIKEVIEEHASILTMIRLGQYRSILTFTIFMIMGTLYLLLFVRAFRRNFRVTWTIPFMWLCLSLSSIRHGPLFAVVTVLAIADLYRNVSWVDKRAAKGYDTFKAGKGVGRILRWPIAELVVLTSILVVMQLYSASAPAHGGNYWVNLDKKHWPIVSRRNHRRELQFLMK
jgi:hypothetical protein